MARKPPRFQARLTRRPLDLGQVLRLVGCPEVEAGKGSGALSAGADPATGAVVGFTGIIRAQEQGRPLRGIRYEEYRAMARKELDRILEEARTRWRLQAAVAIHRTGETPAGHPSVAVAVAAGHRGEAFEAARFLIDALKERVPLWKNFLYAGGEETTTPGTRWPDLLLAVPLLSPPKDRTGFARRVLRAGGNAIELRADALAGEERLSPGQIRRLATDLRKGAPGLFVILTPRARAEGGVAALSVARRKELIETCLPAVDAVDVELRSRGLVPWTAKRVSAAGKLLILSNHDFEKTPPGAALDRLFGEAARYPEALLKIAVTTSSRSDLGRLLDWTRRHVTARPLATMGMGEAGRAGRVLLAALGSRLAFASLGEASASGQVDVSQFTRTLRRLQAHVKSRRAPATRPQLAALLRTTEGILTAEARPRGRKGR